MGYLCHAIVMGDLNARYETNWGHFKVHKLYANTNEVQGQFATQLDLKFRYDFKCKWAGFGPRS